jgi:hypothetical protein
MLSEKERREEQLSVLQKLKKKGMPERPAEDDMRSMFDLTKEMDAVLASNEEEEELPPEEDMVPYAPGKGPSKRAMTPQNVGGSYLKPKKKLPSL